MSPEEIRGTDCTELASTQTESEIHQLIAIVIMTSSMATGLFAAATTAFRSIVAQLLSRSFTVAVKLRTYCHGITV